MTIEPGNYDEALKDTMARIEAYKLEQLATYGGADRVVSSIDIHNQLKSITEIEEKIFTGIKTLDDIMDGARTGQVIVMSGKTKCGKTSFLQTLTYNYALKYQISCLWFTYEIPVKYFLRKFPFVPLFYLPNKLTETNLEWIEQRIIEGKKKFNTKIVFLDHLHYLIPMSQYQNMSILIGSVMRELKKISIRNDVLIYLVAHTAKVSSEKKSPDLDDLRDSSFVAQEADFVLMINRPDLKEDDPDVNIDTTARLRVLANRQTGRRGHIDLIYQDNLFIEILKNESGQML